MQDFKPPPDRPNPRFMLPTVMREMPWLRSYAEFGVLHGDSVCRAAERMHRGGEIWLFDFDDMIKPVLDRLSREGYTKKHDIHPRPNSRKLKDSYAWSLLRMLQSDKDLPRFDYVFLDGAHTYDVDGFTFMLLQRFMGADSYIEFDDYNWTLQNSPTMGPDVFPPMADWYTEEQLKTPHIKLIVDVLVSDRQYDTIQPGRLYRKRA